MDVTGVNHHQKNALNMTKTQAKESNLQQEKEWVSNILELQKSEDRLMKEKRNENKAELAQTYAEQGFDRREQKDSYLKV